MRRCIRLVLLLALTSSAGAAHGRGHDPEADARGYLRSDLPLAGVPPRPGESAGKGQGVRRIRRLHYLAAGSAGGLAGRTIYLSPGHGWVYREGWGTQRPNIDGYVEDLANIDGVTHYLVPWLLAAGGEVVAVRELDPTTAAVVLDDADGSAAPDRGTYLESGDTGLFSDSSLDGYGHPSLPIADETNPFGLGSNRLIATRPSETARATFALRVPASGYYNVYLSYSQWSARPSDAHVEVHHAGGVTSYRVDQKRHGGTWVLLGRHYFRQGMDVQRGAVAVTNRSDEIDTYVSVDAVRLGGGHGLTSRGGTTSSRARADECARYHIQYAGAPPDVYDASSGDDRTDDVGARARFADWVHAEGEEALFLSYHSNANTGQSRGSVTYIYGPNAPDGSYQPDGTVLALGSDALGTALQKQLVTDLRREIDPDWADRGLKSAYFGELNPAHQDEMPAALVELAFHDNDDDRRWLLAPRFRQVAARALYKGIVHYFARRDGVAPRFSPPIPRAVMARNTGAGSVTLHWSAPLADTDEAPTSYRVYRSRDGVAFDDGTDTAGQPSLRLEGLERGSVYYLRVTAINEAGESLPSPTLPVGVAAGSDTPMLLVGGYGRGDDGIVLRSDDDRLGVVKRLDPARTNDGGHLVGYGPALQGFAFDSCWNEALDANLLALTEYRHLIWAAGRGAEPDRGLRRVDAIRLREAFDQGAVLLLSGSTVASHLARTGDGDALLEALGASHLGTTSAPASVAPAASGPLAALSPFALTVDGDRPFASGTTDALEALAGATLLARYGDERGAVVRLLDEGRCAVLAGFALETVAEPAARAAVIRALVSACPRPPGSDGGPGLGDGAPDDGAISGDGARPPDGGCGCGLSPTPPWPLSLLAFLALLLARRRARVSRP